MHTDISCPGPLSTVTAADFEVPGLACDSHAHVIHPNRKRFPFIENRSYTPPPASEESYLNMLGMLGMERGVLVQVSVYGTDNNCMLETLRRYPKRLRGIAVVDADVSDEALDEMHEAGVRGLRINTLLKGGVDYGHMELLAKRIKRLGWHLQFLSDARDLPEMLDRIRRLPVPCVMDHMGDLRASTPLEAESLQTLRLLMQEHGWWVKLSGAYRLGVCRDGLTETTALARSIIHANPDQVVWGSDWPHVNVSEMPDTGVLLNLLKVWAPDENLRQKILVENPRRLYDF